MQDNIGSLYILNDTVEPSHKLDSTNLDKNNAVYEVIRIIERVPLFLEDHYIRLKNSLSSISCNLTITERELKVCIQKLVDANQLVNCNVKVVVYQDSIMQNFLIYVSKSCYPSREEVEKGVRAGLLRWERENPNVKLVNPVYKDAVSRSISEKNVFEVLLVNKAGDITEGSKSNLFFVKEGKVYTAPEEYVLKGITRKYIFKACDKIGIKVTEKLININSLNEVEGLFISGTSIKVLPVSDVDGHRFNSSIHTVITAIRDQFDRILDDYILEHRS